VPLGFQPLFEQPNLGGAAYAIGAFDDDKFSLQLLRIYTWDSLAEEAKSTHVLILVLFAPVNASATTCLIRVHCLSNRQAGIDYDLRKLLDHGRIGISMHHPTSVPVSMTASRRNGSAFAASSPRSRFHLIFTFIFATSVRLSGSSSLNSASEFNSLRPPFTFALVSLTSQPWSATYSAATTTRPSLPGMLPLDEPRPQIDRANGGAMDAMQ
jgi:hypothetical protein